MTESPSGEPGGLLRSGAWPDDVRRAGEERVLFVATVIDGGVEAVLEVLIRGLEERGVRCGVYAPQGSPGRVGTLCALGGWIGSPAPVAARLARGEFTVVHATSACPTWPGLGSLLRWASLFAGTVVTAHVSTPTDVTEVRFDEYTAVSAEAAAALITRTATSPQVIANAPDVAVCTPGPGRAGPRPQLLWVGRAVDTDWPSKGIHGLLYLVAAGVLADFEVVIIDIEDNAETLGLDDWLAGRVDYRPGLRSKAALVQCYRDVAAGGGALISTSRFEGHPMVMLEAMASGCPVIVPDSPGFGMVTDGVTGLKYRRREAFSDIPRCLRELGDTRIRERIVAGALASVAGDGHPDRMVEAYLRVYRSLPPRSFGHRARGVLELARGLVWHRRSGGDLGFWTQPRGSSKRPIKLPERTRCVGQLLPTARRAR
ncbi:Glycosyltransferase involved in cell wall bisynthesis [Nocardia amikacinitolerans]|uniref:Glycosyltransferase involved in cell wall bisynthesis n=2 Tax=Nocardia amikacinitolerans TaxID=756689 RepID=A0A285L1F2_9NOCA|nr:glycosyltransferase family 4 protein [Nocardia amikacinitolerans]MCP2279460.1 Glycosyltransferase involved in cell wall bisynthesis [Nocardia amikacinitolerans]MCP2296743.1 Glycosyltransferase involved in cell wall bisynthesis [Nocardia amikacinitolerans]SNY78739.1 Glycosyltransferase involved in cell wall bisynthesis [Nocardia amikacinitolerans]